MCAIDNRPGARWRAAGEQMKICAGERFRVESVSARCWTPFARPFPSAKKLIKHRVKLRGSRTLRSRCSTP